MADGRRGPAVYTDGDTTAEGYYPLAQPMFLGPNGQVKVEGTNQGGTFNVTAVRIRRVGELPRLANVGGVSHVSQFANSPYYDGGGFGQPGLKWDNTNDQPRHQPRQRRHGDRGLLLRRRLRQGLRGLPSHPELRRVADAVQRPAGRVEGPLEHDAPAAAALHWPAHDAASHRLLRRRRRPHPVPGFKGS